MNKGAKRVLTAALLICNCIVFAQQRPISVGPIASDQFRSVYIRIDNANDGLLYEPVNPGPNARIALIFSHPNGNTFGETPVVEMAKRGYRVLAVNHHGDTDDVAVFAQPLSRGIGYLRTLPGVQHVVIMGHSGGGHLVAWYQNVAEHGPSACQGPEKVYPCDGERLSGLMKPDGVILLDSTLGAFHEMSAVDPAVEGDKRIPSLDMFSAANGYDTQGKQAKYSADFAKRFYAAQSSRNEAIVNDAVARLNALKKGKGPFNDDEPLVIRGMGEDAAGARLYQPDPSFAAHTKKPHTLLKADGTQPEMIVNSVRPPMGQQYASALDKLHVMSQATTVRMFLVHSAIRTKPDFAITADDIAGVDWDSAITSTPGNAEGITVPTLVLANTCHYLMVPDEIIYDHLAAKDKTLVFDEGSTHLFAPCRPEYGDSVKRAFDYVDSWLSKPARF
jgi:hypothetical protein